MQGTTFGANGGSGVHIERSDGNRVEGNTLLGTGEAGVSIGGSRDTVVSGNTMQGGSTGVDIGVNEMSTLLYVQRPPDPNVPEPPPPSPEVIGIPSADTTVSGNTISEVNGAGVHVEGRQGATVVRTTVDENTVRGGNGAGVELDWADDNVLLHNDLSGNKSGIDLASASRNLIEGNDTSGSDGTGISLQAMSLGNDLLENTADDNNGNGIYVGDPAGIGSGNVIDGNTVNNNASSGIAVTDVAHVVVEQHRQRQRQLGHRAPSRARSTAEETARPATSSWRSATTCGARPSPPQT